MFRRLLFPALALTIAVAACTESPTGTSSALDAEDYALVMFGEAGAALEGTMGTQPSDRPFDGRSGWARLPDSLQLSDEQRAEMHALREAFRIEHADELAALRAIFLEARAARRAGASRIEVRAILAEARPIVEALRPFVQALHEALRAVLTDEQRAWLAANRPVRP
jgi:Spy/CpxP family protein refolding chaperone